MAHDLFRAGRLMVVAILALLATACGTSNQDENRPKSALAGANTPSQKVADEVRLAEVQMRVGRAAFDQGSLAAALDLFDKAHKNAPKAAAPLIGKGDALFAQRRFDAAEAAYRAALVRDPASFEANEGLGKTLVTLKKFREGLRAFEAARAVKADAALINKIGVTHELLGDGAAAQEHFREALSLDATSLTARNNLALSLAVSGRYDAALNEMEKVVAAPGSSERHHANLAFIYGLAGRSLDGAPAKVSQAAANKGWNEEFFARTREVAKSGNRVAILDLLNNRAPSGPAYPAASQLPDMPDISAAESGGAASTAAAPAAPAPVVARLPERPESPETPASRADGAAAPVPLAPRATAEPPANTALPPAGSGNSPMPASPPEETPAEMPPAIQIVPPPAPAAAPRPGELQPETGVPESRIALHTAKPKPSDAAVPPKDDMAAPGAGYRVQMGAYATRWLGRALRALGKAAGDVLPENRVEVVRGAAFHTLRSAAIDDRGAARGICTTLRSRNVDCFVTRQARPPAGQGFDIASAGDPAALAAFMATIAPIEPIQPKTAVAKLQPPSDATRPTAAADAATATPAGEYRIQFAAYRRAEHLARGREVLHRMAGDALPAIESLVHADGPKTTAIPYRLRSAPLESRAAAAGLCRSLSEKGVECLVIRHGSKAWRPVS